MTSPAPAEPDDADIARLRGWLKEIGEYGMDLIRQTAPKAAAQLADPPAKPPTINYVAEFTRLCRAIRQIVALELRLRTEDAARRSIYVRSPTATDPRQAPLRKVLHEAVVMAPDRAQLHRAINQRIDAELRADPDENVCVGDILFSICRLLDIQIEPRLLPDQMLPSDEAIAAIARPRPTGPPPTRMTGS